jgi:hypothetical protein
MNTIRTEPPDHVGTTSTAEWTLRLAAAVVGLTAAAVIVFGVSLAIDDLSTQGEMFDGLGTFIGLVICGLGAVLAGAAVLAAWLAGRHPFAAAIVVCTFGVLAALAGWKFASLGEMVSAAMVFGGVLVAGLGLSAALSSPPVAITSPGGNTR